MNKFDSILYFYYQLTENISLLPFRQPRAFRPFRAGIVAGAIFGGYPTHYAKRNCTTSKCDTPNEENDNLKYQIGN